MIDIPTIDKVMIIVFAIVIMLALVANQIEGNL